MRRPMGGIGLFLNMTSPGTALQIPKGLLLHTNVRWLVINHRA